MGKGGGKAPADQTVRQISLPKFSEPYYQRLLEGAEQSFAPFTETGESTYVPYGGQRLAIGAETPDIAASREMVRDISGAPVPGIGQSAAAVSRGIGALQNAAQYGPGRFDPYTGFQAGGADQFAFDPARQFTGAEVSQYMSPYMQAVVEEQKRQAIQDFERQRAGRSASAVQAGAFGGSRQAVQEALAEEALLNRMAGIQATGTQAAFEQAASQFGADRAAQMDIQRQRAAELARTQGISLEEAARVQQAEAAEAARIQQAIEASRQFGAGQALAGEQAAIGAAESLAGLGERARAADIQGAQLREAIGKDIMGERQAALDIAYQDFLRQQQFPMTQYERFAGLLTGLPQGVDVSTQTYQQYNPVQQALGAGISALGLYKGLQ